MVRVWQLRAAVVPVALVGMVCCAGLALGRIYHGPLLPWLVAGAAAGSVLASVLARRLPAWTAGPLSVAALFGYALFAVWHSAHAAGVSGSLVTLAADAARNGIPRLLTALIPVEPQPDTVLVPVVAAWLAGLAGAELAVRGRRVLLGYAPPVLCYAAALYLVGPNAPLAAWPTLSFAGLAALGLAPSGRAATSRATNRATNRPTGRATGPTEVGGGLGAAVRLRSATGAVAVVVAIVALAAAVGPVVAGGVRTVPDDPRRHVAPPRLDALDENPLTRLSGWAANPEQHLFDATVDRDARLRLAVLTDYDGVTWRAGGTYRNAGRSLPRGEGDPSDAEAATDTVTQHVTIADLSGKLLPAAAMPRRVDGVRVAYDTASGTLARPEGLAPGLRYQVVSELPRADVNVLPAADVPSGPAVARLLHLGPGVPAEIERLARQLAEGNAGSYHRAAAIEAFLGQHYRFIPDAPSGHAYPNLGFFLFGPVEAGGQRGTSEQFAAAFAVLARLVGLPTRVVVGFRVPAGSGPVTGADALAWPEVLFTGVGWVPFHPLPQPNSQARPVEEEFRAKPPPSAPPPSAMPTIEVSLPPQSTTNAAVPAPVTAGQPAVPVVAGSLGAVVLLAALGFAVAVPLLRDAQRRRRLDRGPPAQRIAGAWLEVVDALRLAGRPVQPHLTATETAHLAARAARPRDDPGAPPNEPAGPPRHEPTAPPLHDLATLVNGAVFGPGIPDEADADRAATQAVAYVDELRARQPRLRRLLWMLHPGPLRWHRRVRGRAGRVPRRRPSAGSALRG